MAKHASGFPWAQVHLFAVKYGALCVASKQNCLWREVMSEESGPANETVSLAREMVPNQTASYF
jgi:hypothetical protein